jgi:hypothetical protein
MSTKLYVGNLAFQTSSQELQQLFGQGEKRILRATEELVEGKKRPCCWVGCIHRTDKKPGKWQQDVLIDKKKKPVLK